MRDAYVGPDIDTKAPIEYAERRDEDTVLHKHAASEPCHGKEHVNVWGRRHFQ